MRRKIIDVAIGLVLGVICIDAQAGASGSVDLSKLNATNVYLLMPQDKVFIEANAQGVAVTGVGPGALAFLPVFIFSDFLVDAMNRSEALQGAEMLAYPFHYVVDRYDATSLVHDAAVASLKPVAWLHTLREMDLKDSTTGYARSSSLNQDADSAITIQLFYSMTPDYSAVAVVASISVYSSALSPEKYSPYDPESKLAWLKQPVAKRLCIYQSSALSIPVKTPDVVAKLTAMADQEFDVAKLKRDIATLDPYSTSISERSEVEGRQRRYNELIRDINRPQWGPLDSRLMMGMLWAANDGALYKQATQEGAAALGDMLTRSLQPPPDGAVVLGKDANGKALIYKVSESNGRTILLSADGTVISMVTGQAIRVGNVMTP